MNIITYNQVIAVLKNIQERHPQINAFMSAPAWDIATTKSSPYPLLHVQRLGATYYKSDTSDAYAYKEFRLTLRVLDLVNKEINNFNDVQSDTEQIIGDIITEINEHPYFQINGVQLIGNITTEPLVEYSDDETTGTQMDIILRTKHATSYCLLPFENL